LPGAKKTVSSLLAHPQSNRKQRVRHQPEIEAGEEFSVHFANHLHPRKMAMQIFFYFLAFGIFDFWATDPRLESSSRPSPFIFTGKIPLFQLDARQ
jgi:hypothetical protein